MWLIHFHTGLPSGQLESEGDGGEGTASTAPVPGSFGGTGVLTGAAHSVPAFLRDSGDSTGRR